MFPIIFFMIALLYAFIRIFREKIITLKEQIEVVLKSIIFFNIGCMGLLAFYAHTFMPDETARSIGWPTGNPFQFEVAVANLAFGVLGIISPWFRPLFWAATVMGNVIFLFGAAWGHFVQWELGDAAPYNSGPFVWFGDGVIPLIYGSLMLYYYYRWIKSSEDEEGK
ncbi:MAG: hypothetical protein CK425_04455 [Parachlamydia sp.]|nr:MAG: hypothetical protein CK425_04455 [Parachlamydia sp.]